MEKCLSEMTEMVLSTRPVCLSSTSETGKSLHRSTATPTLASQARHLKRSQRNCVAADWHPLPTTPSIRSSGNELQSNTIISARLRCESCAFNPYNEIEEEKALAMGSYRMYLQTDKHMHREKLKMMNPECCQDTGQVSACEGPSEIDSTALSLGMASCATGGILEGITITPQSCDEYGKDGVSTQGSYQVLLNPERPNNIRTCSAEFLKQMEFSTLPSNFHDFAGPDFDLQAFTHSLRAAAKGTPTTCTTFLYTGSGSKKCFEIYIAMSTVGDFDDVIKVNLDLLCEEESHTAL